MAKGFGRFVMFCGVAAAAAAGAYYYMTQRDKALAEDFDDDFDDFDGNFGGVCRIYELAGHRRYVLSFGRGELGSIDSLDTRAIIYVFCLWANFLFVFEGA